MHILEELYIGNVRPGERSFIRNSQYARALAASSDAADELVATLTDEQRKLFDAFSDAQRYDAEVRKLEAAIKTITEAVVLPAPMEETRGAPRSQLRGEKEHPRSGEPFAACGGSDKRSAV